MKPYNPWMAYATALFYVIVYLCFIAAVFSGLRDLNKFIKAQVFNHYQVPLKDDADGI